MAKDQSSDATGIAGSSTSSAASASSSASAAPATIASAVSVGSTAPAPAVSADARLEIATALLAGLVAHQGLFTNEQAAAEKAVRLTDKLIAALGAS
jgi:hypothetical protein